MHWMEGATMTNKEDIAEDLCLICKDGGHLRICDFGDCLKAYHPACLEKDPSFLHSEEKWSCDWHSCMICNKSSKIQCFCCPSAVCFNSKCIRKAELVQVKTNSKGFCSNCLKLCLLIETKADVDSEGEKVDFEDTTTCEFLFKDYWEIVKDKEKLSLEDLQTAKASMESRCFSPEESGSDRCSDKEELRSDLATKGSYDEEFSLHDKVRGQSISSKTPKSYQCKKRNFTSWGSKELMNFLSSIGKDTSEPYTQLDTSEIIKRYVYDNNLLHPVKKKKKVLCDEKLFTLFRKKTVKLFKIHNLLESHFAANEDSGSDFDLGFEEEENLMNGKGNSRINFSANRKNFESKNRDGPPGSCYVSLTEKNIKLVFLRRSLVHELLKNPNDFEVKVVGSFVRVKNDTKDFFKSPERIYELGQVTSIRKVREAYKVGEMSTDIVLRIYSIWKDVQISMLSEDDIKEEECEHLRQLVKKGLHPRPLVRELQKKAVDLHKDITVHRINREIAMLQKQIVRANEKGWRREFHELVERRALLCTPAEQERLLREIPEVIPDDEIDDNSNLGSRVSTDGRTEEKKELPTTPAVRRNADSKLTTQRNSDSQLFCKERAGEQEISWVSVKNTQSLGVAEAISNEKPVEKEQTKPMEIKSSVAARPIFNVDLNSGQAFLTSSSKIEVIDLDGDEDEKDDGNPVVGGTGEDAGGIDTDNCRDNGNPTGWHYVDPAGNVQGPFDLELLGFWREKGFFDNNFKVWRHGHPQSAAILLLDALRQYR